MLRNATPEDVAHVVARMRAEDVQEIWRATGKPATEAVEALGEQPYVAFTLVRNNEPVAIFGATLTENGEATMFRFATDRWPEVVREAIKIGRRVMLPLFTKAGIKRLKAQSSAGSDTTWLRLFGARQTGGFVNEKGHYFQTFSVDLVA